MVRRAPGATVTARQEVYGQEWDLYSMLSHSTLIKMHAKGEYVIIHFHEQEVLAQTTQYF